MLEIVYVFFSRPIDGLQPLRLVWRSIPQAFISLDELIASFPVLVGTRYIENIHNFICDITGEESLYPKPRNLQHYCRIAVRSALSRNVKLFTGIDKLGVPPSMQAFLKLEL
ncbi:hypothetical protein HNY73_017668 [Argiope bruennichi]|uniref:SOCS box domain-containing protein n=1 Tax=Argiope bruennichi TaxID=94029 RepID=A0A8T0EF96_ARGBR|nr:hypothetical protein HNY73_017668 [Argiope bruennichi]